MSVRALALFWTLGAAAPAGAGPALEDREVGLLSGTSHLAFEGAKSYPPQAIALALSLTPRFLVASHPRASLEAYLQFLTNSVRLGYLHGGFPEVKVEAAADPERGLVRVRIEEGRRRSAGAVIVAGNRALAADTLVKALTEPERPGGKEALWKPGGPARFDPPTLRRAVRLLARTCSLAGYLSARLSVEIGPLEGEGGSATLVVKVLEEGKKSTLGQVRFEGKFSDDAEVIKKALALQPGMDLDRGVADGLEEKLEAMGRYLKASVRPLAPADTGAADLEVRLFQASFAPPFGTPPREERAVLRKAFHWLGNTANWKKPLFLRADLTAFYLESGFSASVQELVFELGLSREGLVLQARYKRGADSAEERLGLILDGPRGIFVAGPLGIVSRFDLTGGPNVFGQLELIPDDPEKLQPGESEMKMVAGLGLKGGKERSEPRLQLELKAAETTLEYLAQWERLKYTLDPPFLRVELVPGEGPPVPFCKIERETGEVQLDFQHLIHGVKFRLAFEGVNPGMTLEAAREEARKNGFEQVSPIQFLARTGLAALQAWRSARGEQVSARLRTLAMLLERLLRDDAEVARYLEGLAASLKRPQEGSGEQFEVPDERPREDDDATRIAVSRMLGMVASRLAEDMPRDSWLQAICREAACVISGEALYTEAELRRLYGSRDTGPAGHWALSETLKLAGMSERSRMFAREALRQCSLEGFRNEVSILKREGSFLARVLRAAGQGLRELDEAAMDSLRRPAEGSSGDEEREFLKLLEAARTEKDPIEAGAKLLEAYWTTGLEEALRSRCEVLER